MKGAKECMLVKNFLAKKFIDALGHRSEEIEIDEELDSTSSEIIGASEGKVYKIGDSTIRVYKYDLNQTGELTVSNLKLAQESGKVKIPSLDDLEIGVIYNKGLVLINDEEFENKDKIIEIFKGL